MIWTCSLPKRFSSKLIRTHTPSVAASLGACFCLRFASFKRIHRSNRVPGSTEKSGIWSFDALHLASAVESGADVFCSTDDRLLKHGSEAGPESTRVLTPVGLTEGAQYHDCRDSAA